MSARQELALLVSVPVDGVVEEVGTNTAVIEKGITLARSTIANDLLAGPASGDQELKEPSLGLLDLLAERRIGLEPAPFLRHIPPLGSIGPPP